MSQAEAPLFRVLARKWRPVDRRERRLTPFALALAASDPPKTSRNSFGPNKRAAIMAELIKNKKKSARAWSPWMMTK